MDIEEKLKLEESLKIALNERDRLDHLLSEIDNYINRLNSLFENMTQEGFYHQSVSYAQLEELFLKAKSLFAAVKLLEKIQKFETKHLIKLLSDMKIGRYGKTAKGIANDIKIQKKMDSETETVEKFFRDLLSYFKIVIMQPEQIEEPGFAREHIIHFFKSVGDTVREEALQADREIRILKNRIYHN